MSKGRLPASASVTTVTAEFRTTQNLLRLVDLQNDLNPCSCFVFGPFHIWVARLERRTALSGSARTCMCIQWAQMQVVEMRRYPNHEAFLIGWLRMAPFLFSVSMCVHQLIQKAAPAVTARLSSMQLLMPVESWRRPRHQPMHQVCNQDLTPCHLRCKCQGWSAP